MAFNRNCHFTNKLWVGTTALYHTVYYLGTISCVKLLRNLLGHIPKQRTRTRELEFLCLQQHLNSLVTYEFVITPIGLSIRLLTEWKYLARLAFIHTRSQRRNLLTPQTCKRCCDETGSIQPVWLKFTPLLTKEANALISLYCDLVHLEALDILPAWETSHFAEMLTEFPFIQPEVHYLLKMPTNEPRAGSVPPHFHILTAF